MIFFLFQDELYSDFLDLSLSYNVQEGKLTLGIIKCQLAEISSIDAQGKIQQIQLTHSNFNIDFCLQTFFGLPFLATFIIFSM